MITLTNSTPEITLILLKALIEANERPVISVDGEVVGKVNAVNGSNLDVKFEIDDFMFTTPTVKVLTQNEAAFQSAFTVVDIVNIFPEQSIITITV